MAHLSRRLVHLCGPSQHFPRSGLATKPRLPSLHSFISPHASRSSYRTAYFSQSAARRAESEDDVDPPEIPSAAASTKSAMSESMNKAAAEEGGGEVKKGAQSSPPSTLGRSGSEGASAENGVPDDLADHDHRGRTGGGEQLDSSSDNAPPQPKILNARVPGEDKDAHFTDEQKREVDEHNKDFDKRFDRGNSAPEDKVDKKFWSENRSGH